MTNKKKHSLNRNLLAIDDEDFETELRNRREEAINKSTEVRRKSTAGPLIAGLTASELTQHCRDCIKLSTENKINTKNAFSFLLIDAMAAMSKKADSEINKNFQVASCTLDASVKIYGYRVDAVHTEAIKIAGGVLSKEAADDQVGNENEEDDNEVKKKFKKKKRKKLTIAAPETLNDKESESVSNYCPYKNFLMFKTEGTDLLITIPKFNDSSVLCINSEFNCWPSNDNNETVTKDEIFDPSPLKSLLKDIEIPTSDDHLCPAYHNIEFGKECQELSDENSDSEFPSPDDTNRFEFDLNASVPDDPMEDEPQEAEPQRKRIEVPVGGYESDQEIVVARPPERKDVRVLAISDLKNRISVQQLEYSLFDENMFKCWAGPSYWKVGPVVRKSAEDDKENSLKAMASKRTRKGRIKPVIGLFDVTESALEKSLAVGEKTTLNKSTMLNWSPQNVTVPKDCKYKAKSLSTLFHLPNFHVNVKNVDEIEEVDLEAIDDGGGGATQDELEYCSNLSFRDEPDRMSEEEEEIKKEDIKRMDDKDDIWDENNMVALPNRVEKIPISTFRRKRNVDIKHLKKCLWNMMTENKSGGKPKTAEEQVNQPIAFSEIMRSYEYVMPNHLTSCLSGPLIFNAILHLTNEKCLVLTQNSKDKTDFVISQ